MCAMSDDPSMHDDSTAEVRRRIRRRLSDLAVRAYLHSIIQRDDAIRRAIGRLSPLLNTDHPRNLRRDTRALYGAMVDLANALDQQANASAFVDDGE